MNYMDDSTPLSIVRRNGQSRYTTNDAHSQESSWRLSEQPQGKKSRINQSPLKSPLESAINKVVSTFGAGEKRKGKSPGRMGSTPRNNFLAGSNCSNRINNFSVQNFQDDKEALERMHPEAMEFLKKYFSGYSASQVPTLTFVDYLTKQFSTLWTESQAKAILPEFTQKILDRLGQEHINMAKLCEMAKENGLIGLILNIFRELKQEQQSTDEVYNNSAYLTGSNVLSNRYNLNDSKLVDGATPELQNVKNIIQQFTEGLYKSTENEIYSKLNVQMRRLVLKYKETEGLLKTVNDKINENIDKLHYEKKKSQLQKNHELQMERMNERVKELEAELHRERLTNQALKAESEKYQMENRKLSETVDRFQNHLLKTTEEEVKPRSAISHISQPTHQQPTVISFAYQSPNQAFQNNRSTTPVKPSTQQGFIDHRKIIQNAVPDKQNVISINTLNGVVRPTTPIKGKPSASPNRFLRVQRNA